jgi:cellulose synthase (UDP-forming)
LIVERMQYFDTLLPLPPSDEQKFSYVKRHVWLLNLFALSSFAAVAYSTILFSELDDALWPFFGLLGMAGAGFVLSIQADLFSRDFDHDEHRRRIAAWPRASLRYPSVDVFLPICGEDRSVLLNTWRHVLALDYPRLTVYCLDDGGDETMRSVAEELGFRYLRRENPGWFKKAGNLQFAYENSCGEFILILDADFAPRPDFLRETLPYFAQPDLGIVQTPQFFATSRRQNWLERGAGAVQELFYRVVQVSRGHRDAAICVGTCAVYRRAALDSNGGTTLIEHSEDIHTGFDLRRRGWRLQYIPVNLAAGLCPDNLPGFFRQQYRWCLGSLSLCTARKFWSTKMPPRTRMCYLAGFAYYILTALAVITAPLIPLTLTLFFPGRVRLLNYLVLLPALLWLYVVAAVASLPVPLGDPGSEAHLRVGACVGDPRPGPGTTHGVDGDRQAQARAPAPLVSPPRHRVGNRNRRPADRGLLVADLPQRPFRGPVRAHGRARSPVPRHEPASDLPPGGGHVAVTTRVGLHEPRSEGVPCDGLPPTPGPRGAGAGGACCGRR